MPRETPFATRRSPFAIRHSPLAIRHSPLATRHSPLAIRLSPLAVRHSPLAVRHSPFPIPLPHQFGHVEPNTAINSSKSETPMMPLSSRSAGQELASQGN